MTERRLGENTLNENPAGEDLPSESPLDALVAGAFVSRGDEVVARRIAGVVDEPGGWSVALLALAIRAVREGSSALDLTRVGEVTAEVERGHEDDVEPDVTTLAETLSIPTAADLAQLATDSALTRTGVTHVVMVPGEDGAGLTDGDGDGLGGDDGVAGVAGDDGAVSVGGGAGVGHGVRDAALFYLDRHYRDELLIADLIAAARAAFTPASPDDVTRAHAAIADVTLDVTQRRTVDTLLTHPLTVLTGGPGMGKTYTLAAVIRAARAGLGDDLRLALAAPTGKAAARMTQSLRESGVGPDAAPDAVTLHRLLGFDRSNHQRFVHNRSNPLPHDLVVVDEASMLSLALMARLMEALKPTARLLLVGDADQLASVEAGSVLSDLVAGLDDDAVVRLTTHHRLSESRRDLALAFAALDADAQVAGVRAVLDPTPAREGADVHHLADPDVTLADLPHVVESAWALRQAAASGDTDAALDALRHHRLLCAHRTGPYGVARWNRLVEAALAERGVDIVPGRMYVGRPIIVTKNDPSLGLFNGDSGVVMDKGGHLVVLMDRGQTTASQRASEALPHTGMDAPRTDEALTRHSDEADPAQSTAQPMSASANDPSPSDSTSGAEPDAMPGAPKRTEFSPWRLADVETMHAMTVHKAQGSQAEHVTVIVPPVGSRLLTREMLYTALTRASGELTVVGSDEAIERAVRTPVRRASGLASRLRTT